MSEGEKTQVERDLVSRYWDDDSIGGSYREVKKSLLFIAVWKERPDGSYVMGCEKPFVAIKQIDNQGVIALRGFYLHTIKEDGVRKITKSGKSYVPKQNLRHPEHELVLSHDLDKAIVEYLKTWDKKPNRNKKC